MFFLVTPVYTFMLFLFRQLDMFFRPPMFPWDW